MAQVTGGIYEIPKQVTEMLEKGSENRFFTSAHVQLASDAAAYCTGMYGYNITHHAGVFVLLVLRCVTRLVGSVVRIRSVTPKKIGIIW
jgi:predicted RecA/RadA family phage recombinase